MNAGQNSMNTLGPLSWLVGTGFLPQFVLGICISTILYILLLTFEAIYNSFKAISGTRVDLLPFTCAADDKPRQFEQNPSIINQHPNDPYYKLMPFSDNERSGAEFSYSFFLWVNPSSFRQEEGLLHIMHKGYSFPYPLMSPGVFLKSNTNSIRVYMNSSQSWNNYIEVENIPVKKWVHITIVGRANGLEIYINGNLTKKLNMENAVFYQNFGNLYLFNSRSTVSGGGTPVLNPTIIPSMNGEMLQLFGTYNGNMSRLVYFSYALSYTEIQTLVNEGPSRKTETNSQDAPPYLEDAWWVTNYNQK
jgi:hypothetical protein